MASIAGSGIALAVSLLVAIPLRAQEVVYQTRSEEEVTGTFSAKGVDFSAFATTQDFVVVSLVVKGSVEIDAEVDYGKEELSIKALSLVTKAPTSLSVSDQDALAGLGAAAAFERSGRVEDALASTLNFLASYPSGAVVNLVTAGNKKLTGPKYTSLCGLTGSPVVGTYTVGPKTYTETAQLGPCYSEPNECLGRCGPGCGGIPGSTIQRFTQECFNHDLCTRKTGQWFGNCLDEWIAAAYGFFFAPDCGSLKGTWSDNYAFDWTLSQDSPVQGTVATTSCLVWDVSGTHDGANLTLVATNPLFLEGCCQSFIYTGQANDCNSASGTWENDCSGSGNWSLVRQGGSARITVTDSEGNPATPALRH